MEGVERYDDIVLLVRHCYSCSNRDNKRLQTIRQENVPVDVKTIKKLDSALFRQPLCTAKGIAQAVLLGKKLRTWKNGACQFSFFSSFLPRAMLTSKMIAWSVAQYKNASDKITPVHRLCDISEFINPRERALLCTEEGTENVTSGRKSNCVAKALNDLLPGPMITVEPTTPSCEVPCGSIHGAETGTKEERTQLQKMKNVLKELDFDDRVKVIVTHGRVMESLGGRRDGKKIKNLDVLPVLRKKEGDEVILLFQPQEENLQALLGSDDWRFNRRRVRQCMKILQNSHTFAPFISEDMECTLLTMPGGCTVN